MVTNTTPNNFNFSTLLPPINKNWDNTQASNLNSGLTSGENSNKNNLNTNTNPLINNASCLPNAT